MTKDVSKATPRPWRAPLWGEASQTELYLFIQVCGNPKTDAHHKDYMKPLKVIWLCRLHHSRMHNGRKAKGE